MNGQTIVITQGEHAVSSRTDVTILTLLGSCVACCLWDPVAQVGGMNHMLFTSRNNKDALFNAAGVQAMDRLIDALQNHGAERHRLKAKAFGGARMVRGLSGIGAANGTFVMDFLKREGIPCEASSLGNTFARQIQYWPVSGVVRQKLIKQQGLDAGRYGSENRLAGQGFPLI